MVSAKIQRAGDFIKKNKAWCVLVFALWYIAFFLNVSLIHADQTFIDLARSFLDGKLYFTSDILYDTATYNGMRYWPLGPFPAVILVPFVWLYSLIGASFYQGYLNVLFGFGVFLLWMRIARNSGYDERSSLIWACAFIFASPLVASFFIPVYAHFAHTITALFLSLAFCEYSKKNRPVVLGLCMAAVCATRITAGFGSLFFVCDILFLSDNSLKEKIKKLTLFLCPLVVVGFLLGIYNFARFGSPFEPGYSLQLLFNPELIRLREQGLMSAAHILPNLYFMLLALPDLVRSGSALQFPLVRPNPWGMSIFITSPYFLYFFFFRYRSLLSRFLLLSVVVVVAPLLLYYGIGYRQFGNRYALDFMPFLFYLLLIQYREKRQIISRKMSAIIFASILINVYLFMAFFST